MNDFESRWQTAADAARNAPPRDDQAPFGFASRVVALRRTVPATSPFMLWWKLTWRAIGLAALLLVASAALNWSGSSGDNLEPAIVDSMSDIIWLP